MQKVLIVIGGGAAGFFCAVNAAQKDRGLRVIILEKTGKLLSKVRVSGGGRCNVTHACFDIAGMAGNYPRGQHFVRKAFHQFFTTDTIEWFASRGVELKTEADGRMFPVSDSSETIIDCLMREVNAYRVEIRMHADVKAVGLGEIDGAGVGDPAVGSVEGRRFRVVLADGRELGADYLCVACGGYPKSAMFDWIRGLGHTVEEPLPSLFTFNMPGDAITKLMGISVPQASVKIQGSKLAEQGPLLITHWGVSGPVVLRLSAWGARELAATGYHFGVQVNWLGELSEQKARELLQDMRQERAGQGVGTKNPFGLPQRLWDHFLVLAGIVEIRWADLPARELNRLVSLLCAGVFAVAGKTTFKEEFVTAGGVRLAEVDPATFQSRKVPGLFFAGEILDVDGITGGYNFQHAWTSGWIAADSVAAASSSSKGAQ
jgi:predicted Rossmann fold flavoprotein